MRPLIPAFLGIVVIVVVVLIIIDVVRTLGPTSSKPTDQGTCTLVRRIVLPDYCSCSVAGKTCTAATTRPYAVFFTQAASCPTLACDLQLP
ncbi:MAG: hypothetical protein DME98_02810 [Verrucomicrobia bacterium]|nr:MAG: hypothetical protein DME98_02810 [Verrucomicrobiota bacterium]PYJ32406.1 MAG: hypothetical protein DME88_11240 [Verrucomicrobiota bacterium]